VRDVQGVDGVVTPVGFDGGEHEDYVWTTMANSKAWSAALDFFRGEAGERLEMATALDSLLRRLCDAKRPGEN
jgi:hypothetical protein